MKITSSKLLGLGLGAAALCAAAVPAHAASFTQPGGLMGVPAGVNPPPGLYFGNALNWGIGTNVAANHTSSAGVEVPFFIYSPGWSFLGASYAASVAFPVTEIGTTSTSYVRGFFNPAINPVALSWNLGNGFFVSFAENIYIPVASQVVIATPGSISGAAFEQRVNFSYLANDWILSANNIFAITTADSMGVRSPDTYNIDGTIAHTFGKWELGIVGYAAFDLQTTPLNAAAGRGVGVGVGGLVGYNFGVLNLTLELSHQVVTRGATDYGKGDTRVWTAITIPIWNPAPPPAPRPAVAKY